MGAELTMTTWTVTYSDYSSSGPTPAKVKVSAAYYAIDGRLVEFKDTNHQVVFAVHSGIIATIHRGGTTAKYEQPA